MLPCLSRFLTAVPTRMAVGGLTAVRGLAEPGRAEPLRLIGRLMPEGGRWLAINDGITGLNV